ncbi:universal stress protein [Nakamurella endophytica]|uniref:UspA domain-containing protein n=1 Tax=Nakamurella endophytica TaxID=1748367 RepID=A0A917WEU5_9ACTN|nr:universal stress protein [Nakamurella endophytica]GGL96699.1 hypothetical protein GCM10011594_15540 [Nakamurella endophytica]
MTCAFSGTRESLAVLRATAAWTRRLDVPLRVVTLGVRGRTMYPPEAGLDAEDMVLAAWLEQARREQEAAVAALTADGPLREVTTAVAAGDGWADAVDRLDWDAREILVIGSTRIGPVAQVFLGSRAVQLVRHAPVPALMVPDADSAAEVLARAPEPG